MSATEYTVAFIFDKLAEHVLLIHKKRPKWQEGLLNGIGGHINPGESVRDAMSREVREETNLDIKPELWIPVCAYKNTHRGGEVYFAAFFWPESWRGVIVKGPQDQDVTVPPWTQMTDEELVCVPVSAIQRPDMNVMANLRWVIPMALECREPTPSKRVPGYVIVDSDSDLL